MSGGLRPVTVAAHEDSAHEHVATIHKVRPWKHFQTNIWNLFKGLDKDMVVNRLTIHDAQSNRTEPSKTKYVKLANGSSEKVSGYHDEADKMKYLRTVSDTT